MYVIVLDHNSIPVPELQKNVKGERWMVQP